MRLSEEFVWSENRLYSTKDGGIAGIIEQDELGFVFSPVNREFAGWKEITKSSFITEEHIRQAVHAVLEEYDAEQQEIAERKREKMLVREEAYKKEYMLWQNSPWYVRWFTTPPEK